VKRLAFCLLVAIAMMTAGCGSLDVSPAASASLEPRPATGTAAHSPTPSSSATAGVSAGYVGGLVRAGVCLVLAIDDESLELRWPEGWHMELRRNRMVMSDADGKAVANEGDRIAFNGIRERLDTGSFCMVGDDIVRVREVIQVWPDG
jgi:hypothetical protein